MKIGPEAPDVRADVVLVAGVLVLFGGRLAFGGDDAALDASLFGVDVTLLAALVLATVLCALAVRWSEPFGGAVRALVAAITFLTLAVDPTTGWDGNAWYVAPGAVFALVAFGRSVRRRPGTDADSSIARNPLATNATSLLALLLVAAVLAFGLTLVALFWALQGSN